MIKQEPEVRQEPTGSRWNLELYKPKIEPPPSDQGKIPEIVHDVTAASPKEEMQVMSPLAPLSPFVKEELFHPETSSSPSTNGAIDDEPEPIVQQPPLDPVVADVLRFAFIFN